MLNALALMCLVVSKLSLKMIELKQNLAYRIVVISKPLCTNEPIWSCNSASMIMLSEWSFVH